MKSLFSKKIIIGLLSVATIVLAGTMKDIHTRNSFAINSIAEEKEIIPIERNLASEEDARVALMDLPINSENNKKINTNWEITRIVGSDEKVVYDKLANPEDSKKMVKVSMELIGRGIVRVNHDNKQVYRVSLLSDFGTIALFKKYDNGYEIIEAKKIIISENNLVINDSENIELVLDRALNPAKSDKVLVGEEISGQVSLNSKTLIDLRVELRNINGETQNIDIDNAELKEDGSFKAIINNEEISGVVFNNGKAGYRISFITGPIAGSMLDFATKEYLEQAKEGENDLVDEQKDEQKDEKKETQNTTPPPIPPESQETPSEDSNVYPEQATNEVVQQAAEGVIEERKIAAQDVGNEEPVQLPNTEDIK